MTREEKQLLQTLLITACDAYYGYRAPGFTRTRAFTDDTPHAAVHSTAADEPTTDISQPLQAEKRPSLNSIAAQIATCTRCPLARTRTKTVPGMGREHPVVLVVGEGPGHDEDVQGLPFVGPAGKLLDKMLSAINLDRRTNCYIANVVKCRPPHNRTPYPEETAACGPFLAAQIQVLKPHMILAAGRTAAHHLLATTAPLTRLRGRFFSYGDIPVLVTYHPSALLRDASLKRPTWEDLKLFRAHLLERVPDYASLQPAQDMP
ncbi:MAG: uracil-DNA glycosylase [Treponema sp.]|nr:uracil-DNA glycosylase [Treponema sp.]